MCINGHLLYHHQGDYRALLSDYPAGTKITKFDFASNKLLAVESIEAFVNSNKMNFGVRGNAGDVIIVPGTQCTAISSAGPAVYLKF
jgi:hypothetical protein